MDWRAITAGIVVTGVLWLIGQLVYVLVAFAIGMVSSTHVIAFFSDYKEQLWFVTAIIVYSLTMIAGGYVTAFLANRNHALNGSIAGGVTGLVILASSLGIGELSWKSILLVVFGFSFGGLGGLIRLKTAGSAEE